MWQLIAVCQQQHMAYD